MIGPAAGRCGRAGRRRGHLTFSPNPANTPRGRLLAGPFSGGSPVIPSPLKSFKGLPKNLDNPLFLLVRRVGIEPTT